MLKADRLPPATGERFWRPERKAWAILLSAFALFCMLAWTTASMAYQLAVTPKTRTITARVVQPDAAFVQRAGRVREERLVDGSPLSVGDRVFTSQNGPAGIAARLHAGGGTVALWPSTSMLVEQRDQGVLRLKLEEGQALIDLPRAGPSLFVSAGSLAQEVEMQAPGRYRIRGLSDKAITTARAERHLAPGFEVATDRGLARMGEVAIRTNERFLASGSAHMEVNRWSLLRDGDFRAYTEDEYRATLHDQPDVRRSDTWILSQQAQSEGAFSKNGFFYLLRECDPPDQEQSKCRNVVRLARLGGNEKDSTTGINQDISADVAAYRSVTLAADVRIDYQKLSKGGADGSECPLFARVDYANGKQAGLEQYFCFWAKDDGSGAISKLPYILSQRIEPKAWHHFSQDLRALIPDLRVIEQVIFYSNGHDYDASVANVSLQAEGLTDVLQP